MWSPRVGLQLGRWRRNGSQQIRGGIGLFSGRTPYVWLSNQYGNTGIEFQRIGVSFNTANRIPFVADPNGQPKTVTGATAGTFANEIDVIDPDYKYPSILRGNIAYDRDLGFFGLIGTAEFLYSKNVKDIHYENLNIQQIGSAAPTAGRIYARNRVPTLTDVILLTNTNEGRCLERGVQGGPSVPQGLLHGRVVSVRRVHVDHGRHVVAGGVELRQHLPAGRSNNPPVTRSNFDPGHRITISGGYDIPVGEGIRSRRRRSTAARPAVRGRSCTTVTPMATAGSPTTCCISRRAPAR